ncbi:C-C motif chemokine 5 isoform X2 [Xenopus tropicalis]|uniref:C-C motif chemokine n=1 Tax=Xenopus tropicalis TaxID=8364 RepID=A0A8J1J448_XENTR|nr:C-C motif chemokine 5 isoform X2 [Xenopus tropicalis]
MKATLIILSVFLFVAFYNGAESAPGYTQRNTETFNRRIDDFSKPTQIGSDVVSCCFDYIKKPIPPKHVADYFYTSSRCSRFAVVLVTRKNRKICANPEDEWVNNIINVLEVPETQS